MPNVENLKVCQRSHELALRIYELAHPFPSTEMFGLIRQMRRAASSIPMNLAEGSGRSSDREVRRSVDIAQGSATELTYQLRSARDLSLLSNSVHDDVLADLSEIRRMLRGLRRYLSEPAPPRNGLGDDDHLARDQ